MEKLTAQEKSWVIRLESNNPATLMTAIKEIRDHGNIRMLPYLFRLMQPSTHQVIRESILMMIGELKTKDAVPVIVGALEKADRGVDFARLVAACWQSSLDFSHHIPVFIRIFIDGDYQTAVEAFSVVEESIMNADSHMQKNCLKILENSANQVSEEKYPLYRELIKVVSAAE
jgi:hypothetical protein